MVNIINETTQALRTLTVESNNDCLMVTLLTGLLDQDTRERWETSLASTDEFPTLSQLTEFLVGRARTLETMEASSTPAQPNVPKGATTTRTSSHQASQQPPANSSRSVTHQTSRPAQSRTTYPCDCCGQDHYIAICPKMRGYSVNQRVRLIRDRSLCCNCLGRHNLRRCNSRRHCKSCNDYHHTLLHGADLSVIFEPPGDEAKTAQVVPSQSSHIAGHSDSNSRLSSFINSSSSAHRTWIRNLIHLRKAHPAAQVTTKALKAGRLWCRWNTDFSNERNCHTNPSIKTVTTILPAIKTQQEPEWPHLKGLNLADPEFLVPRAVEVIVGADFYGQLIRPNIIRHSERTPIAQLSIFWWLVIGPIQAPVALARTTHHGSLQVSNSSLRELLTRFWVQEEPPSSNNSSLTPEEQECELHFKTTHSKDSTGHYIVRMPLKSPPTVLGDSYQTAHRSLQRILRRLGRDTQYDRLYTQFMREYEQAQHILKLDDSSVGRRPHYYLPHRGVHKPDSSTTKLRVVFNGSSASSTGHSLNDIMLAGPNLMLNIFDLLIWIRQLKYLFATDITKMYRQIKIHPDDQDLQRIVWLTTVTYGTKSAPFLAVRTLLQLAEDEGSQYPLAVKPITHRRYVDDIFGGSDTVEQLVVTAQKLIRLCHAGGFPLAKWHSTSQQLLREVSSELGDISGISFDDCDTKILGIRWSPQQDMFDFSTISSSPSKRYSKRLVLSEVAQIFDPLGFASPVIIKAKIFLQALWLHNLDWAEPLSEQFISQLLSIRQDLISLARLSFPRWFNTLSDSAVELHGFSDASQFAMAAVVYLVVNSPSTGAKVSLICSRTKVSPLKRLTIPRLELSAALLLSTLMNHVCATLNMIINKTILWTDSKVTLTWIKAHPSRWKDYVRNRVNKIQELSRDAHWRYVSGTSNPADCASRGITTDQLEKHSLWWTGPPWLTQSMASWPAQIDTTPDDSCAQEARARVAHHALQALRTHHRPCSQENDAWRHSVDSGTHQTTLLDHRRKSPSDFSRRKSYVLRCVVCARYRGIRAQQLMGQLPLARVTPSRPFSHTGIDYAGPLTLKTWKGRGSKTHKGWICVFVCLSTSAAHLDVVSDYSAEGFIATYRRFTSRRGVLPDIYADCNTNFLGAEVKLMQCFSESSSGHREIFSVLAQDKTQWHFNQPAAPNMGGKWEAVVKSLKFHLRRSVGDTLLTYEEISTLLAQVEAILNSRPLEPLSEDPEDISVLTPGHFLIGTALNAVPEGSVLDISASRLSRWQFIQQRVQHF
ncbi:PREDICTED: uncharacterized protein LOC107073524 [Polistes dominula]|uniref:Uncharacterized protein LOC107073524 n=1 Tax=Polistes dominula TaxID=743375 RepID=A0ABM1JB60_POLDO|nr:PREDICTED: uncharacterized protein LOC107073524 [Polistes dominula]